MSADAQLGPLGHAVAGGIGGVIGLFCTYPLDIVKTRMQVGRGRQNNIVDSRSTADASVSGAFSGPARRTGPDQGAEEDD